MEIVYVFWSTTIMRSKVIGTVQKFLCKRTGIRYWRVLLSLRHGERAWHPRRFETADAAREFLAAHNVGDVER